MTVLNTSLICLSLKYFNKNYKLISNVSKWVHFELTKLNYKESKFIKSLDKKDFEIIKTLIKFNKNIDLLSGHLIRYYSNIEIHINISKLLIENEANIHTYDNFLLRQASVNGHYEMVKLLIDKGANIHVYNDCPLISACRNGHYNIVKLLIDNGANVHARDDEALLVASYCNHVEIINLLKSIDNYNKE